MLLCVIVSGDGVDPALLALLAAAGKSAGSLPPDMATALTSGKVRRGEEGGKGGSFGGGISGCGCVRGWHGLSLS